VFKCQAVDRNDKLERATKLINIVCRNRHYDTFKAFCESLIKVGQQRVVDKYFPSKDTWNLPSSGI